jgi:murein DD-endopeptidase MepM/ murein hydrolase activator NlpD
LVLEATDALGLRGTANIDVSVQAGTFDTTRIYLSASTSELLDPQSVQSEAAKLAAIWVEGGIDPLWEGQFARPLRPMWHVSSSFGQRRAYNAGAVSSYHAGVDFGAKQGALVLAPAAGRVVLAEPLTVRGNAVILDHGAGVHSGYWHLWQIFVANGDEVQKGDVLARVGNTGLSTGAHLHWELRVGDVAVDPLQWTQEVMPRALLTGTD